MGLPFTSQDGGNITDNEDGYESSEDPDYDYEDESEIESDKEKNDIESIGVHDEEQSIESTGVHDEDSSNNIYNNDTLNDRNEDEIIENNNETIEFTHPEDNNDETNNLSDDDSTEVLPTQIGRGKPHSWKGFKDAYTNVTTNGKMKQYTEKSIAENLQGN